MRISRRDSSSLLGDAGRVPVILSPCSIRRMTSSSRSTLVVLACRGPSASMARWNESSCTHAAMGMVAVRHLPLCGQNSRSERAQLFSRRQGCQGPATRGAAAAAIRLPAGNTRPLRALCEARGATQDRWQGSGPPTAAVVPRWRGHCMTPPGAARDRCSAAFWWVRPPVRPGRRPGRWMARRPRRCGRRGRTYVIMLLVAVPVLTGARVSRKLPGTSPASRQRAPTPPPQPLPDPGSPSAARTCQPGACHRRNPGPPSG